MRHLQEELASIERVLIDLVKLRGEVEIVACDSEPPDPPIPSLTEHVRRLVAVTTIPLLATQIRDSCEAVGIQASSRKNLLIQVHTALQRMRLDVRRVKIDGKGAYLPRIPFRSTVAPPRMPSVTNHRSNSGVG